MAYTLNENLKRWAEQYETAEFVKNDPVQIPRHYDSRVNIEISAFVTAWIAWGNRKQIIKKADFIDREIFKGEPYNNIVGNNVEPGAVPLWQAYKESKENFYRTFTYGDFAELCDRLHQIYSRNENMEAALLKSDKKPLEALQSLFGDVKGIPDIETKSGCKRLCMFLRWMCRPNSPVDFGLWTICDPRNLIIPLDTHVHKQALRLGLITRRTPDLQTAIEITDRFAEIFPDDPAKGDFALFGYGVNKGTADTIKEVTEAANKLNEATKGAATAVAELSDHLPHAEDETPEPTPEPEPIPEQPIETKVADLSIADVLKMPLFFANLKEQITSLWQSRENARQAAGKNGERLKNHIIDQLHADGLLDTGKFAVLFAKILDKVATGYSANEREFIRVLGMTAFKITMQKLIDDEKERDNSDGDDKQ